jgi:hypothetical protein
MEAVHRIPLTPTASADLVSTLVEGTVGSEDCPLEPPTARRAAALAYCECSAADTSQDSDADHHSHEHRYRATGDGVGPS